MVEMTLLARFKRACTGFEANASPSTPVHTLDAIARDLAQSLEARIQLGSHPSVWVDLKKLWRDLARSHLTFWDADDSEGEESDGEKMKQIHLRNMCSSLAKFTRNLVAGVPENQNYAFENEPNIRRLLHYHTSWSTLQDPGSIVVARLLAQALSNIVTGNEALTARIWETYLGLPEDQVVLIRLLSSPDERTLLAILVFILNCIHDTRERTKKLSHTPNGVRISISLLDNMVRLYEAEEGSEGAQAFDIGYSIISRIIEEGFAPELYAKFAIPGEIVTPHQTTLLKLMDSHLQSTLLNSSTPEPRIVLVHVKLCPMIREMFFELSTYAQQAILRALGPTGQSASSPKDKNTSGPAVAKFSSAGESSQDAPHHDVATAPPSELDPLLPKVCEALVLISQCAASIILHAEDNHTQYEDAVAITGGINLSPKAFFNEKRSSDQMLADSVIELLRGLASLVPRINFGKNVSPPASGQGITSSQLVIPPEQAGFSYLKRDLVRLLGVLCYRVRAVQDRIRNLGGIQVIMGLCVIDERNPYIREHAILALHNLLENNAENQAFVDSLRPRGQEEESRPSSRD